MDGVVMGGGVGLSAHAAHRVVTERSAVAMPEVGIGFFPDIGVVFRLARSPGFAGTYLVLTGERMDAADAIYCGLADMHIASAKLAEMPAALADCRTADDVRAPPRATCPARLPAGKIAAARPWIDGCYGADNVEEIVARLRAGKPRAAQAALATMRKKSPTSLKITLRNIRDGGYNSGALRKASSRITASRWPASPGTISSKASAPRSSTRTAIRPGGRTRSKTSRRRSSTGTSDRSASWN